MKVSEILRRQEEHVVLEEQAGLRGSVDKAETVVTHARLGSLQLTKTLRNAGLEGAVKSTNRANSSWQIGLPSRPCPFLSEGERSDKCLTLMADARHGAQH